jgi:hypothetical protein
MMVRSELLRAKSLHAEVAYLRDLKQVSDAKRAADQHNNLRIDKERQFWTEALKAKAPSAHSSTAQIPVSSNVQSFKQLADQLERMHRAHSQLQQAHKSQQAAAKNLHEGLVTLSGSQKRVEVLEALLVKAKRTRANQVESQLSEDLADLVSTAKTVLDFRASRSTTNTTSNAPQIQPTKNAGPLYQPQVVNQIGISNVAFTRDQGQPSLSLACAIAGGGSVNLQITKADKGGLKVVIDPSIGSVASGLIRDKLSIQSRLQAIGIKVSAIEVGVTGDTTGAPKRAKRSQFSEEEDEGVIS